MMKKNRTIYFLLALVCLGLQSCLFQEEDYFDDSSANRATADVKRCSELLEAAPNGWVMEYYVGKDYSLGGITFRNNCQHTVHALSKHLQQSSSQILLQS